MNLFHGTSLSNYHQIIEDGCVKPRFFRTGNFNTGDSANNYVYLTDSITQSHWFAYVSALKNGNEKSAILSTDLDNVIDNLYPDENYFAYFLYNKPVYQKEDLLKFQRHIKNCKHLALKSLEKTNLVAYKGKIKLSKINSKLISVEDNIFYHPVFHENNKEINYDLFMSFKDCLVRKSDSLWWRICRDNDLVYFSINEFIKNVRLKSKEISQ